MQYVSRLLDPTRLQRQNFSTEIKNQLDIHTWSMSKNLRVIIVNLGNAFHDHERFPLPSQVGIWFMGAQ